MKSFGVVTQLGVMLVNLHRRELVRKILLHVVLGLSVHPLQKHTVTQSDTTHAVISCLRCCICLTDSPALQTQCAVCTVKRVTSFDTWQHRFDVDSNFLSYPSPWYNFTQNVTSSSVVGSDHLPQISLKYIQYLYKVKEMPMQARDGHQDSGT